jgi:hypothetical protein
MAPATSSQEKHNPKKLGVGWSGWREGGRFAFDHSSQLPIFLDCVFPGWRWLEPLVCPTYQPLQPAQLDETSPPKSKQKNWADVLWGWKSSMPHVWVSPYTALNPPRFPCGMSKSSCNFSPCDILVEIEENLASLCWVWGHMVPIYEVTLISNMDCVF